MKRIFGNRKSLLLLSLVVVVIATFIGISYSVELENDVEVARDSVLTYYLNVTYDGVDRNGVASSDSTVAMINSGYITVEDRIPDGLTFEGFVTTTDGTIGAVRRSDNTTSCLGRVVDDTNEESLTQGSWNAGNTEYTYHGLHYDVNTRTVSFKVNKLQAGCVLTVGIITRTPDSIDDPDTPVVEKRRDFYNFATAQENSLSILSNTVHVYMSKGDNIPVYTVTYVYGGTAPTNAPTVPPTGSYAEGITVGVANDPLIEGYTFSGWSTSDVTVTDNLFEMPNSNVTFTGTFTERTKYNVSYTITGITPEGYVLPFTKQYYEGAIINLDSLQVGEEINGYRFLGWSSNDVTLTEDNNFVMPNSNVSITGQFELVTYTVSYDFYDGVLPPNADEIVPEAETHLPGETVTLPDIDDPSGYKFLGWYKENEFRMPKADVEVFGEFSRQVGTFEPTITKEVVSTNDYFFPGQTVRFRITVTNTAPYALHDVIIRENNENAYFVEGEGYTVSSTHYAQVASLAGGGSINLYAEYVIQDTDKNKVTNEAELVGALADNDYVLKEQEYKATAEINIRSKLTICKAISGASVPNTFQIKVSNSTYETWVTIKKDECESIYLNPGIYNILEVLPQEYTVQSVTGAINGNSGSLTVVQGTDYTVTFTNKFVQKGFYHSFGRIENRITG